MVSVGDGGVEMGFQKWQGVGSECGFLRDRARKNGVSVGRD